MSTSARPKSRGGALEPPLEHDRRVSSHPRLPSSATSMLVVLNYPPSSYVFLFEVHVPTHIPRKNGDPFTSCSDDQNVCDAIASVHPADATEAGPHGVK